MIKATIKGVQQFKKDMKSLDTKRVKSAETATKVEGFRLKKELSAEILAGAPGGQVFHPLTKIGRRMGKPLSRGPLKKLAKIVRYRIEREAGNFTMQIGFVDPTKSAPLSKSWMRIVTLHQAGGTKPLTPTMRANILGWGIELKKKPRSRAESKFFFLKKATTQIRIPARPIIDPFWSAHEGEAFRNIESNYERKMRGERI